MQELLLPAAPETHRIRAEVKVIAAALGLVALLVFDIDPALFVVPALAHRVLVLHGVHVDFVAARGEFGVVHHA